jgi:mono/diheme cytochrome c family protein
MEREAVMNRSMKLAAGLLVATAVAAAAAKFDAHQLAAGFYYDLGPDALDVSKYPQAQRDGYKVFAETCSKCHTLARPLNSPLTSEQDWRRYMRRMHGKTKSAPGTSFTPVQAGAILDFLVYDAKVRKLDGKAAFAAQTKRLKDEFREAKAESARLQSERDAKAARQYDDHAGATPHPQ